MTIIQIVGKNKRKNKILDEAKNKKEAKSQVNYWEKMLGKGWTISTKAIKK